MGKIKLYGILYVFNIMLMFLFVVFSVENYMVEMFFQGFVGFMFFVYI